MKYTRIHLDSKLNQNPQETTRFNKNVVYKNNAWTNEQGLKFLLNTNYFPIGQIAINNNNTVIFSTNNTISEIGILTNNNEYAAISTSSFWKFNREFPIHGSYYVNNLNEVIIAWVDEINIPRCLNLSLIPQFLNTVTTSLFPFSHSPNLVTALTENGNLKTGAYYPICRYVNIDGSTTSWFKNYNPVYLTDSFESAIYGQYDGSENVAITNKSIDLHFTQLNTNYKYIEIGYIRKVEEQLTAFSVKKEIIKNSTGSYIITGQEQVTDITLEEIIVDKPIYKNAKQLINFNDALFLADLEKFTTKNHQTEINKLVFNWKSELKNLYAPSANSDKYHKNNNEEKAYPHDEVIALYIRFGYFYGTSDWQPCIGRLPISTDLELSTIPINEANKQESTNNFFKKYQVFDTCTLINQTATTATGTFSYWENSNETYLENQGLPVGNVRHFKFPSHNWMRNNVWKLTTYGTNKLDKLSIVCTNINLFNFKDEAGNMPLYYEIGYAKRNLIDTRIQGQSLSLNEQFKKGTSDREEVNVSLGGNWKFYNSDVSTRNNTQKIRLHPFELLRNKPALVSNFFRVEYVFQIRGILDEMGMKEVRLAGTITTPTDITVKVGIMDASLPVTSYTQAKPTNFLFPIKNQKYLLNNTINGINDNINGEEAISIDLESNNTLTINKTNLTSIFSFIFTGGINNKFIDIETALVTLLNIKTNYYLGIDSQQIVNTGKKYLEANDVINGGDVFICDYSYITYGKDIVSLGISNDIAAEPLNTGGGKGSKYSGFRIAYRVFCESKFNINLRTNHKNFINTTAYYPNVTNAGSYKFLGILDKDINPNDFVNGYSDFYHAQNIIEFSNIFNFKEKEATNELKLITSSALNNEFNINTWRDFKPNNYYYLPLTLGELKNLEADKDFIYIHFEKSLLRTIGRQKLQISDKEFTVGSGDILQNIPEAIVHDKYGFLGTQHKWSCLSTPYGYIFLDAQKGIWWLIENGKTPIILSEGLEDFFTTFDFCEYDNPFFTYGVQVFFDEFNKRLLITHKGKQITNLVQYKGVYKNTQSFVDSLNTGDIVIKNGQYKIVT